MGDESSEARGGSADIVGDGGALLEMEKLRSSQPQILNVQRATLNYAALLIPRRINNVEHHGKEKIANQDGE